MEENDPLYKQFDQEGYESVKRKYETKMYSPGTPKYEKARYWLKKRMRSGKKHVEIKSAVKKLE